MARKASTEERAAYATACALSARLIDRHPDIADELGELLDAVKVEQRLATERGRPIYTATEDLIAGAEEYLALNRPAGTPRADDVWQAIEERGRHLRRKDAE